MLNIGHIVNTVQTNCDISDARHAGNNSMCIFLLKMREHFRWENGIPLSLPLARDEISAWISTREQIWEQLESDDYLSLPLETVKHDPFDVDKINSELLPHGYVYSSGYGLYNKPHFILGQLLKKEEREGITILVSSCEHARDIDAPPAMMRDNTIFISHESIRRFIWQKIEEWQWNNEKNVPMKRALSCYGHADDMEATLDRMTENEAEAIILHEIGEVMAGKLLGAQWEQMLHALSRSRAALIARSVRDLLADCLHTMPVLIERNNTASLHFYFANLTGVRSQLFPEAREIYEQWIKDQDPENLLRLFEQSQERWLGAANDILKIYKEHGDKSADAIAGKFGIS